MIVVLMGVSGAGKTTVGVQLAALLGWTFADADDFHSAQSVAKMAQGIALDDADRDPWLAALRQAIAGWLAAGRDVVLACSALKARYREQLQVDPQVRFVYLKGSREQIGERLRGRRDHFAGESLLASQFAALEEPEDAITVDIGPAPGPLAREIARRLGLGS